MLGALTVALSHGVLNVAIPSMMSSLGTDLDRIQWVQTAYAITQAVLMPAVGWLGARLGTKRLVPPLDPHVYHRLGAVRSGMGRQFPHFLPCPPGHRWLASSTPLGMSILYSTFPPDKRGLAMGLYNFSHSFGPAIAPALGGHLIEVLNWRAIFYINVPVGLISAALSW